MSHFRVPLLPQPQVSFGAAGEIRHEMCHRYSYMYLRSVPVRLPGDAAGAATTRPRAYITWCACALLLARARPALCGHVDGFPSTVEPSTEDDPSWYPGKRAYGDCPWHLNTTTTTYAEFKSNKNTASNDFLQCGDGSHCDGAVAGWDCCSGNGNRRKCPPNYPEMCFDTSSSTGGDHVCEVNCCEYGGPRPCISSKINTSSVSRLRRTVVW